MGIPDFICWLNLTMVNVVVANALLATMNVEESLIWLIGPVNHTNYFTTLKVPTSLRKEAVHCD